MKPIACLLSLSISFVPYGALALSARTVSIEEAQGINGSVITLEVAPGYGLNINLIPTGEIVKKAWIDDPSRITLSFDGNLCQGATDQQCNNEGATVIHLRQIQPIAFPHLPRSPGGGTLLTLITEGSQGRKIYQFKVMPVSGAPKYTVLNVNAENPTNTPLLRGRNVPLMVNNNIQRRRVQNYVQQPQDAVRAYRQRNSPRNSQIEQTLATTGAEFTGQQPVATKPNKPIPTAPVYTPIILPPITNIEPTPIAPFSSPLPPLPVNNKLAPTVTTTNLETASTPNNKPKQNVAISIPKTSLAPNSTANKPKTTPSSEVSPSPNSTTSIVVVSKPSAPQLPNKIAPTKPQASTLSVGQANALVRGLVVARQKGQINSKTKVWKQVQSVVLLLRHGATAQEAAKKVGVSLQLVEQLIAWGNNSPVSTITSSK